MGPADLIERYRTKGVLIDTNLLVLLTIGLYRRDRIASFKRTRQYTSDDFDLIARLLGCFSRGVTTPNILTEVHNLTRQLPDREHNAVARILARIVGSMFEVYVPSRTASTHARYADLGLTNTITLIASGNPREFSVVTPPDPSEAAPLAESDEILVVTDDFSLWARLSQMGKDALNINHIRTLI